MKPDDFAYLAKFLLDKTGLVLSADKSYLVESRLNPIARKRNLTDLGVLVAQLRLGKDIAVVREVTDAMMTNESFFFRDTKPFEHFRNVVLPRLMAARVEKKALRIWSAACSTGQEPYTLAMILCEEAKKLAGWRVEIVGTDISHDVLERAKQGVFTQFEVQRGLPIALLVRHFKQEGDRWRISEQLRGMVQYRIFNLLQDPAGLGAFDVVFCRNVLIYFNAANKGSILGRIAKVMAGDGALYLGGAETVLGISDKFAPIPGERGVYGLVRNVVPQKAVATA